MGLRQEGYWDSHYQLELRNYDEDGDEGEVWFGKILNRRIVNWIHNHMLPKLQDHSNVQLIDIGCGNAYTIRALYDQLIENQREPSRIDSLTIYGLDYAAKSIELSRKILADQRIAHKIHLKQCDFLCAKQLFEAIGNTKFDYIIDKGTFDAICLLSSESTELLEANKLKYMKSLYSLIDNEAIFIIASCNHTEEELLSLFKIECSSRKGAELIDKIDTPRIKYGGQEGSQVTCLIIKLGGSASSCDTET